MFFTYEEKCRIYPWFSFKIKVILKVKKKERPFSFNLGIHYLKTLMLGEKTYSGCFKREKVNLQNPIILVGCMYFHNLCTSMTIIYTKWQSFYLTL